MLKQHIIFYVECDRCRNTITNGEPTAHEAIRKALERGATFRNIGPERELIVRCLECIRREVREFPSW